MPCSIKTRYSTRKRRRSVKTPCNFDNCSGNVVESKKAPHVKEQTFGNGKMAKQTASRSKSNMSRKEQKAVVENNQKSIKSTKKNKSAPTLSGNKSDKTQVQEVNNCVVLITALPRHVIEEKLKNHFAEVKISVSTGNKVENNRETRRNKSKDKEMTGNQQLSLNKDNTKTKPPLSKYQKNIKKVESSEKLMPNIEVENRDSSESPKTEEKENAKKDHVFRKPIFNNSLRLHNSGIRSKLRKRKTIDYAEQSLNSSSESQEKHNNLNKVPVYKQPIEEKGKKQKRNGDLYEFDESDSEYVKKKKKRKISDYSTGEYDKIIKNVLKNVVRKIKKKPSKKAISDVKNNNIKQIKTALSIKTGNIEVKSDKKYENKDLVTKGFENTLTKDGRKKPPGLNEISKTLQENNQVMIPNVAVEEDDEHNNRDLPEPDPKPEPLETVMNKNEQQTNDVSQKIKILSNIQLQPDKELNLSITSPSKFREIRPKANSTMISNVFSPWRFNQINIRRNPHFLSIKESNLPSISQEMVLDHSIVDKFDDLSKTYGENTPLRKTENSPLTKKTPTQKYVTDYFGGGKENEDLNKENVNISLFDDDQFSPIKNRNRNQFGNNKVELVKRKVLGERNDNVMVSHVTSSTPVKSVAMALPLPDPKQSDDEHTNFGFSSDDEEENCKIDKQKKKVDKPFRVSVNLNDKKYTRRPMLKKQQPRSFGSIPLSDEESDPSDLESHSGEVKLFEDFTNTLNHFERPRGTKKKTKVKWLDDGQQQHRKRKDVRTKEEEEEAERWAAAFNSMCEEIEEFPLEIE